MTVDEKWNEGEIEVNINRCSNCEAHQIYARHEENEYVQAFNDSGDAIQSMFPNAIVKGNYEKPKLLDEFEVYLRGVGWKKARDRDESDRFFIYRKS